MTESACPGAKVHATVHRDGYKKGLIMILTLHLASSKVLAETDGKEQLLEEYLRGECFGHYALINCANQIAILSLWFYFIRLIAQR